MKVSKIFYCFLIVFLVTSCKKYVELEPKGKITPTTLEDYKLLINNNTVLSLCYGTNDFLTDDVSFLSSELIDKLSSDPLLRVYKWDADFYNANDDDPEWNLFYKQIYTSNVIIDGVSNLKNADEREKNKLIAQAKVHRAYAYLCLINLYAEQFVAASANTDMGVPLLLIPDINQSLKRASVAMVYDQILDDLNSSIGALPEIAVSKTYPSKVAAYAILARAYLQMGNYEGAAHNANLALSIQGSLLNLNDVAAMAPPGFPFPGFFMPASMDDPEVILIKSANNQDAPLSLSPELLNLFTDADLRKRLYTFNGPDLGSPEGTYYAYFAPLERRQVGPRVPEMMLIKAECLVREGKYEEGLDVANQLRRNRLQPAGFEPLTASNKEEALRKVLEERRRELFGRGFRLFDLKRLNLEAEFAKPIKHPLKGDTLILQPGDNRYIYPIAKKLTSMNEELLPNPR